MAAKDRRLFARIDLDYADHPKIAALSDGAFRAHVEMILYSRRYLTDGHIPNRVANRFGYESLTELLTNDKTNPSLVKLDDDSYILHGYSDMQETKAEVEGKRQVNRENGQKGGRPRKTESVSGSGTQTKSESKAETETETELKDIVQPPAEQKNPYTRDFDEWWSHYPRKESKGDAFKAWESTRKAKTLPPLPDMIAAADAYARKMRSSDPQFVKLPAGWLRDRKWEDESPVSGGGWDGLRVLS